ncbi:MAG: site-specific integrase [Candidatus Zixiibacteriota bacterium]
MSVYKKDQIWHVDCYLDGKRHGEAIGPNRKMADSVLAKRKALIAENKRLDVIKKPKFTFDDLAKEYMVYDKTNKRSSPRDDLSIRTIATCLAGKRLADISELALENYKKKRLETVPPATVNRKLACLKHMFTKAIQWGMATANPAKAVRFLRENSNRIRSLTRDEVQLVMEELPKDLNPLFHFALHTAMRKGESFVMTWNDVDLKQKFIFVRGSKNGEKRELPMADEISRCFTSLPKTATQVFDFGNRGRTEVIRKGFAPALKKAGIEDFRFHDLRLTFARHLVMAGVDLLTVKEQTGHKSINMTLRYARLNTDHKRRAIESKKFSDGHYLDTKKAM